MIVATYTARHAGAINHWLRERGLIRALGEPLGDRTYVTDDLTDHVILVDFEHGGRQVLEACDALERPVLVLEDNPTLFTEIRQACENYVYGDVGDDRVWELARVDDAALVVSLTPERDRTEAVVGLETDTPRIVRVDGTDTAREVTERGAAGVIYPDAIAAERVGDDLEALLQGEIDREEFARQGGEHFEAVSG